MSEVQTWSTTAASNSSAAPNGFPEGMPPSGVNDAAREVMAAVARYRSDTDGVNTSSGTDTITLAASRTMTAYAQGDFYMFKAGGTNTGAATLNVDSLGAKNVYLQGAALTGGEILSGQMVAVVYDGTQFQLVNPTLPTGVLNFTAYKRDTDGYNTSAGTSNVMTLGASQVVTAYAAGDLYTFKSGTSNSAATTINVDGAGAKNIYAAGAALSGGEIVSGRIYTIVYDGTQFQLLNPSKFPTADGAVGAPSIAPTSDSDTGFYFAANTINAATGGTQALSLDSTQNLKFNSGYGSVETAYGCRAWVSFDGTGTPTARGSGNVSSITDNGTGDYTINFTTAMPDANYAVLCSTTITTDSSTTRSGDTFGSRSGSIPATGSVRVLSKTGANSALDASNNDKSYLFLAILR